MWKTLAGWLPCDDHSIVVNKGMCNTLDAKVCTMLVSRFKAPMPKFGPLIDRTTSGNAKKVLDVPSLTARPLSLANKVSTGSVVVKGGACDKIKHVSHLPNSLPSLKPQIYSNREFVSPKNVLAC